MAVPCDLHAGSDALVGAEQRAGYEGIATGGRRLAEFGGRRVPVWDFNNVDVNTGSNPKNKLYFSVRVAGASGVPCRANVCGCTVLMPVPTCRFPLAGDRHPEGGLERGPDGDRRTHPDRLAARRRAGD